MASISSLGFDRLVDQVIAEALGLLSDKREREVVIRMFGLRDGIYQSDTEIAKALRMTPKEVRFLGYQGLRSILAAREDGRLNIGAYE